jgi:hypothetical protein
MDLMASPWFWGLGGAFIYAAPKLSACYFSALQTPESPAKCVVDAGFAVVIGPIAAAAFSGTVQANVSLSGVEHMPAVAAVIGLLANPVAPGAIEVFTEGVMKRIRKLIEGTGK